jgi:uncharacterized LabA/DUF88 family protein
MEKKVCVFVDGENLRHSIEDLFPSPIFEKHDYLPKRADWAGFYNWISKEAAGLNSERVRTYWYCVRDIDFSPYNLKSVEKGDDEAVIRSILTRKDEIKERLSQETDPQKLSVLMRNELSVLIDIQNKMERRFSGWTSFQDSIARNNKAIEFRRAGSIRYDLFTGELGREKAVDVKLATDLIELKGIYDVAVIVSGDQDYIPAVEIIKNYGKTVINVGFLTNNGKLLPGGARRLNQSTDWSVELGYGDTRKHFGL